MKLDNNDVFESCVIFDTAPTGHTLRLLNFPGTFEKGLGKMLGMFDGGGTLGPIMDMAKNMLNLPIDTDMIKSKLGDILPTVRKMKSEFEDPNLTTFVCVCIAEFLSLYETERLVQVKFYVNRVRLTSEKFIGKTSLKPVLTIGIGENQYWLKEYSRQ